jgi:hypothetical protein
VTLYPAQLWGLQTTARWSRQGRQRRRLGRRPAGDPDARQHVFIRGREIPLVSRQTELRDRYMDIQDRERFFPRN